ncbi:XrtA system polysaccharide deacetylase [Rhodopirellula sallentina]|uniref:Xylanase/chitin deacetylase n=1 Tax=Rhodopirellula sallentina SM41 TaxID=1263870 RepID=M5U6N2_9BACT|nr:XrtA system polysaccharide deacetylase [Rhodopirellula sallentina]EMI56929.1 xylanase/chitin deacetylase [Rhodopirellula sallentina SM41]
MSISSSHSAPASHSSSEAVCHALTVDVEDYYQVSAFEHRVSRKQWDTYESRVVANTERMLSLFDDCQVRGTFFVLGWVAERFPALVQRIAKAGHEVASHGYWHRLVYDLTPEEFAGDIAASKDAICNACGVEVTAYRAPSFSIVERSLWALEVLVEHGFTTDSSIFPINGHDRYGMPGAKREIHTREIGSGKLVEFPPTLEKVGGVTVPIGGGYFRLFPRAATSAAIRKLEQQNRPAMFYIHPWEIDPDQPRVMGVGIKSRFRHCVGLAATASKLSRLISGHRFGAMEDSVCLVDGCGSYVNAV